MSSGKRSIYVYESTILTIKDSGESASLAWHPQFAEDLFEHIINIPLTDRTLVQPDEWFFHLEKMTIDKRPSDPTHEDCIYGYFEGVKIGITTDLRQLSTMSTRTNPKKSDESEIRNTYFYLRLKDGLLLLDNFDGNVVTKKRLESYLLEKGQPVYHKHNVRNYNFFNRVNLAFIEELNKYDVIRLASVRLQVQPDKEYDTSDAIGAIKERSKPINPSFIDLTLHKKNARKYGLKPHELKDFLLDLLRRNDKPIAGIIEGSRSDGGPPKIKLKGIEEKHSKHFPIDGAGEVLPNPIFDYMIELGNNKY